MEIELSGFGRQANENCVYYSSELIKKMCVRIVSNLTQYLSHEFIFCCRQARSSEKTIKFRIPLWILKDRI